MNKLMQRIFSAQNNGENPILDQIQNDVQLAKDLGEIERKQYRINKQDDGSLNIYDKVHNESTRAIDTDNGIHLTEVPKSNLSVGDSVSWREGDNDKTGRLISIGDNLSQVDSNGKILSINTRSLSKMESNKEFSKSRARRFLIDSKGNLMATGWESSLGKLMKDHPDWKMVSQYDITAYVDSIEKKFSNFSDENQKVFTKPYRRYVILDETGKYRFTVDVTNAKGLITKNPGWTMVREVDYNKKLQENFKDLSNESRALLMERGSLSTAN